MKKLLGILAIIFACCAGPSTVMAQAQAAIITVNASPNGACAAGAPWQINAANGTEWYCGSIVAGNGTWTQAAGGSIGAAPINSPAFTGTPTAPTAASSTNTTQIATTAFVQAAVTGATLGAQAADTVVMNATGSSAVPTAVAMPTCTTGADLYNTTTHTWSCVSTGSGGAGLFSQVLSATPTQSGTGLTTAFHQSGTFSATDASTGILLVEPTGTGGSDLNEGIVEAYPGVAFTATALFSLPTTVGTGEGPWEQIIVANDLTTGKVLSCGMGMRSSTYAFLCFNWNNYTSFSSYQVNNASQAGPFIWVRYTDDGTNIKISTSTDGTYFYQQTTFAKSGSFLGSSGYNYLGVGLDTYGAVRGSTLLSWSMNLVTH